MPDKPILMIVNSVYQLVTAIHIRCRLINGQEAELLLTDVTPQLEEYLPKLQETGLFSRILFAKTHDLNSRYMVGPQEEISEGYCQVNRILQWGLSDELQDYSQIYFSNYDTFSRMLACRYYYQPCSFICYEDGFSTYVIDYLRENRAAVNIHPDGRKIKDKIEYVLLYEPGLAMRGDNLPNRRLPKIDPKDENFRELLNFVFSYTAPEETADFIFLEQSFRAEGLKTNDLELMRECEKITGSGRFLVKPHPRNPENIPYQLGITRQYACKAPWELVLLNGDVKNKTVVTVCSNGALTSRLVFGMETETVMLYELFEGKVLWQEDKVLKRYLRQFHRQFSGQEYYVPRTHYELRHILNYLGGRHER